MDDPKPRAVRRRLAPARKQPPAELGLRARGAASPPPTDSQAFLEALRFVLSHEQGYVNHPEDPGGPTNYGVTEGFHDERSDHKFEGGSHVTPEEARRLYYTMWQQIPRDLDNPTRTAYLDTATLYGPNSAMLADRPDLPTLLERRAMRTQRSKPVFRAGHINRLSDLGDELALQLSRR